MASPTSVGQDCQAVENTLGRSVRLGEPEPRLEWIDLLDADRLATHDQKITLRRMNVFVEVHLEREHDVVGIHWMTVGETQAPAKSQYKFAAVV